MLIKKEKVPIKRMHFKEEMITQWPKVFSNDIDEMFDL